MKTRGLILLDMAFLESVGMLLDWYLLSISLTMCCLAKAGATCMPCQFKTVCHLIGIERDLILIEMWHNNTI